MWWGIEYPVSNDFGREAAWSIDVYEHTTDSRSHGSGISVQWVRVDEVEGKGNLGWT